MLWRQENAVQCQDVEKQPCSLAQEHLSRGIEGGESAGYSLHLLFHVGRSRAHSLQKQTQSTAS